MSSVSDGRGWEGDYSRPRSDQKVRQQSLFCWGEGAKGRKNRDFFLGVICFFFVLGDTFEQVQPNEKESKLKERWKTKRIKQRKERMRSKHSWRISLRQNDGHLIHCNRRKRKNKWYRGDKLVSQVTGNLRDLLWWLLFSHEGRRPSVEHASFKERKECLKQTLRRMTELLCHPDSSYKKQRPQIHRTTNLRSNFFLHQSSTNNLLCRPKKQTNPKSRCRCIWQKFNRARKLRILARGLK